MLVMISFAKTMRCCTIALIAMTCHAARSQEATVPCSDDPVFSQQDFTLGRWDVYLGDKKAAEVVLEKVLKDCVVHETWTPTDNQPGNGLGLFNYSRLL